jgi:hypothetical protein
MKRLLRAFWGIKWFVAAVVVVLLAVGALAQYRKGEKARAAHTP